MTAETVRTRRRRKLLMWPLTVVLAAALGTGGRLLLTDGDDGDDGDDGGGKDDKTGTAAAQNRLDVRETVRKPPASTLGTVAFRFSVDDMSPGERYEMPGMWATDKILAEGVNQTVVGLAPGTDAGSATRGGSHLRRPDLRLRPHVTGENRTAVLATTRVWRPATADRHTAHGTTYCAASPPLCGAGSRSNSPSRAPRTKARHSASV